VLAERRRTHSVDHAGLEVEDHRAWCVFDAQSLVVNHVVAAELRVVVAAAVLAVDADAVLVALHLLKLGAHLVTSLARLHAHNLATKQPGGGLLCFAVLHGKQEMPVARVRLSRTGK
jgi:hypothetical protein